MIPAIICLKEADKKIEKQIRILQARLTESEKKVSRLIKRGRTPAPKKKKS